MNFLETKSYDQIVEGGNRVFENMIMIFGTLIVIAVFISILIAVILSIKARHKMRVNISKMVEKVVEQGKQEDAKHECRYCGQPIGEDEYCPNCGAKQMKE